MFTLNSDAIEYIKRRGFKDAVLDVVKYTT